MAFCSASAITSKRAGPVPATTTRPGLSLPPRAEPGHSSRMNALAVPLARRTRPPCTCSSPG